MKEIIITGGRDYDDWAMVQDVLLFLNPGLVIQGGAEGADKLAKEWCEYNNVNCVQIDADWNTHGKSAGPKRNLKMVQDFPKAIIVAFPGGKGTENCIKTAVGFNRIVMRIEK